MHLAVAAAFLPLVAGHAWMTFPPTRQLGLLKTAGLCKLPNAPDDKTMADGTCRWFSQGCQPGCSKCTDNFNIPCLHPMAPTNTNPKFRTWLKGIPAGELLGTPWTSPGYAPVFSPCGLAGGGNTYHPSNGALAPQGVKQGFDGKDLPELSGVKTEWSCGSTQEVAWSIEANHGGGYAYRLCPKSRDLTEECFQANHLQFVGNESWIQYGDDESNRTAIAAPTLSEGTNPKGSQWKKNPIPACGDPSGGVGMGFVCKLPPQFEPPLPGLYGYGGAACFDFTGDGKASRLCTAQQEQHWIEKFKFNIIDKVQVPADLTPGEYLLSFRWDTEQTPQVWAQCADITITAQEVSTHILI